MGGQESDPEGQNRLGAQTLRNASQGSRTEFPRGPASPNAPGTDFGDPRSGPQTAVRRRPWSSTAGRGGRRRAAVVDDGPRWSTTGRRGRRRSSSVVVVADVGHRGRRMPPREMVTGVARRFLLGLELVAGSGGELNGGQMLDGASDLITIK